MVKKREAKKEIRRLIEKFGREKDAGNIYDYNEEEAKKGFIEPLLEALGWNTRDRSEVSLEHRASGGRVDYALKINSIPKTFVEAKPPKKQLKDPKLIAQAINYGYNRGDISWVLLTDFEEFRLFDVTIKPTARNLEAGLKLDLTYDQYLGRFDDLWLLSRESVAKGEVDLLLTKPKERIQVNRAFLEDLKSWRERLAKDIYKHNPAISAELLREATQRLLDRIIFIRSCEDRKITVERQLRDLVSERRDDIGFGFMPVLKEIFDRYNRAFNSDLFSPNQELRKLKIDFRILKEIILQTYDPYLFDVLPVEILGNIYEQYLGYTIRLTDKRVKYELKPEVRKAGGIYYTPEYVVDYIVKNTVGRLLSELKPKQAQKIRILDPACGSGSFLIRAYKELEDYFQKLKTDKYERRRKAREKVFRHQVTVPFSEEGESVEDRRLTISEKREIVLNHIFGVDIDEQAVEVTRLSLMLKMLEGEMGMVPGRAMLPMLDYNIQCGNSLISGDVLELKEFFGDDWYRVKPFDWKDKFREIMVKEGGFDVVIGNPPWVSLKGKFRTEQCSTNELRYLTEKYEGDTYRPNIYEYFIKRAMSLLRIGGRHSFIVPDRMASNLQFQGLRRQILETCKIHSLVFRAPFPGVIADTIIYVVEKGSTTPKWSLSVSEWGQPSISMPQKFYVKSADQAFFFVRSGKVANLVEKIEMFGDSPLCPDLLQSSVGFIAKPGKVAKTPTSKNDIRVFKGGNVFRYSLKGNFYFCFTKSNLAGGTQDVNKLGAKEKILLRKTGDRIFATLDYSGDFSEQSLYFLYSKDKTEYNLKYFLALLNSRLLNFYYITMLVTNRDATPQLKKVHLDRFPIRTINFTNSDERKLHDDLVALVDVMLHLNKKIQTVKGSKRDQLQRQIEKTDREIDQLVYKLYGLTKEEIKVIEGGK